MMMHSDVPIALLLTAGLSVWLAPKVFRGGKSKLSMLALTLLFAGLMYAQVVTQTVATVPFRIACGQSSPYTDSKGQVWQADADFNAGATYATGTAVTGSPDTKLYQSQRYSRNDSPALTYTIPLANGSYTLNLYFSEIYGPAATVRVFNVKANGTALLTNFNIASDAGGAFKADVKSFPVTVTNGNLIIEFDHVAGTPENPAISAIEVLAAGPLPPFVLPIPGYNTLTFPMNPIIAPDCTDKTCSIVACNITVQPNTCVIVLAGESGYLVIQKPGNAVTVVTVGP